MNRLLIAAAVAAAACVVSVPAVAGLANNPSFSHRLPVQTPTQARLVHFNEHGAVIEERHGSDESNPNRGPEHSRSAAPGEDNRTEPSVSASGVDATGGDVTGSESSDTNGAAPIDTQSSTGDGVDATPTVLDNGVDPTDAETDHSGSGGHGG